MKYLALLFSLSSAALCYLFSLRINLPYNEQGRFFDPEEAVIYHEQAAWVYLMLGIGCLFLAAIFFVLWRRKGVFPPKQMRYE